MGRFPLKGISLSLQHLVLPFPAPDFEGTEFWHDAKAKMELKERPEREKADFGTPSLASWRDSVRAYSALIQKSEKWKSSWSRNATSWVAVGWKTKPKSPQIYRYHSLIFLAPLFIFLKFPSSYKGALQHSLQNHSPNGNNVKAQQSTVRHLLARRICWKLSIFWAARHLNLSPITNFGTTR